MKAPRESDIVRVLVAAKKAGHTVKECHLTPDGEIRLRFVDADGSMDKPDPLNPVEEWRRRRGKD